MKILAAHNFYRNPGGEDVSFRSEIELLRRNGHDVRAYTRDNAEIGRPGVGLAVRTIWNTGTTRDLTSLFAKWRPDVAHFNNTLPLISLSGVHASKSAGIPVVMSIRNYRFRCVNGLFFRDGIVCEDCLGRTIPWPGVAHGCYRESRAASLVGVAAIGVHRAVSTYERKVDVLIALSEFAREKMVEDGLPRERIVVKPNFIVDDPGPGPGDGGYALYVGRLSNEKGLGTLLRAWVERPVKHPLKIVGGGPLETTVEATAADSPWIELVGHKPHEEVLELMGRAGIVIVPSEWYETFGRVVIESYARGTPVVVSRIGAIAELVEDGVTGRLFEPGNAEDLANQVGTMIGDPEMLSSMRVAARRLFERRYTADRNYEILMGIYQRAIDRRAS